MSKHTLWKNLSCDLTTEEIATYSQELASITSEQSEIEAEKKEVMSNFAAKLNKCIADGRVLARKIITKKEDRNIECDLDFDYGNGMVYTVRTDTCVTISQRKLSDEERQEWLDSDAEEGRKQEAEDSQQPEPEISLGESLQTEHKPEVDVCGNTKCYYHDATEGNGCKQYEEVWGCKQAYQEVDDEALDSRCFNKSCPSNDQNSGFGCSVIPEGQLVSDCNSYKGSTP
ncbi:MAG: hypothetical protein WCP20_11095 [Desulfuromonadales bacterium]